MIGPTTPQIKRPTSRRVFLFGWSANRLSSATCFPRFQFGRDSCCFQSRRPVPQAPAIRCRFHFLGNFATGTFENAVAVIEILAVHPAVEEEALHSHIL